MQYNLEALNQIDIGDVIESLGGEHSKGRYYKCFNKNAHKNSDKHASLALSKKSNSCTCYACGISGNPVSIAKVAFNDDFKKACEWLHDTFNIPYLDGVNEGNRPKPKVFKKEPKKINYMNFDKSKLYHNVKVNEFLGKYNDLKEAQKLKMAYTFIYRFSLYTNQDDKVKYYKSRGIEKHTLIDKIGFLSPNDLKRLLELLEQHFPVEDLIKFKLYNDANAKFEPLTWKYGSNVLVIPSFDLYSDMVNGFMLRPTEKRSWGPKEFQISCQDIVDAFPFAMNYNMFDNPSCSEIYFCEGHIDGFSLNDKNFVAIPGVHSYKVEWLGLFKDKKCFIAFDADDPGIKGAKILAEELAKAGAIVEVIYWDSNLGNDLNELLINGNIKKVLKE